MYKFDEDEIIEIIKSTPPPSLKAIKQIVNKAIYLNELDLFEIDSLLKARESDEMSEYIIRGARILKKKVFGNKVKIYVPVYISSKCSNNCIYCGFRRDNNKLHRKRLTLDEFNKELQYVVDIGHRNIELVLGYDTKLTAEKLALYVEMTSKKLKGKGGGSIILMSEPMKTQDYEVLRKAGLTEVYCWQETYNPKRYRDVHPEGTNKHNYIDRLVIFDRVLDAGIQRYGMGVLFGLNDWEYDILCLLKHAKWLKDSYGIAPYSFGIPRLKKASGASLEKPFYRVTNKMYRLSVAVYRLIFPFTHTYMNTRENLNFIIELLNSGGTEINTEASTVPGGYTRIFSNGEQFFHYSYDSRKVFEILQQKGFKPSFNKVPLINRKKI